MTKKQIDAAAVLALRCGADDLARGQGVGIIDSIRDATGEDPWIYNSLGRVLFRRMDEALTKFVVLSGLDMYTAEAFLETALLIEEGAL